MTRLKQWFVRYKHQLSLGILVIGFIFDNIALREADFPLVKLALLSYLGFIAAAIVVLNLINERAGHRPRLTWLAIWLPLLIQFAFGNLFSGFFVLYFYSAPWVVSWPFLIILFLVFLSSEFGKKHYLRFSFQLVIFYLALYSFLILFLPIMLGEISARVFLLSGVASLAAMAGFLTLSAWSAPKLFTQTKRNLMWGIGGTLLLINVFYFTNILPPIPLVLKDSGVYHSIVRSGNDFLATGEELTWWQSLKPYATIHLMPGESAYVYGAIFAPINISTDIIHHWNYYDDQKDEWISRGRIKISITGGRESGYRSYSFLKAPAPGRWRVNIETSRGQVIGRQEFEVQKEVKVSPLLPVRL
jgi:hypothetical protein